MTTLTINIPEDSKKAIEEIASIVDKAGGYIAVHNEEDDDLSEGEIEALKLSYKEALLIKEGKVKGIPVSELWND